MNRIREHLENMQVARKDDPPSMPPVPGQHALVFDGVLKWSLLSFLIAIFVSTFGGFVGITFFRLGDPPMSYGLPAVGEFFCMLVSLFFGLAALRRHFIQLLWILPAAMWILWAVERFMADLKDTAASG